MSADVAGTYPGRVSLIEVTIPSGTAVSNTIGVGAGVICGISFPAAIDGTAFNVQSTVDNGSTYLDVYDEAGAKLLVAAIAARYNRFSPQDYAGINKLRIKSNTNETADRVLTLHIRAVD